MLKKNNILTKTTNERLGLKWDVRRGQVWGKILDFVDIYFLAH